MTIKNSQHVQEIFELKTFLKCSQPKIFSTKNMGIYTKLPQIVNSIQTQIWKMEKRKKQSQT